MGFWDFFGLLIWSFFFVAYLVVLFHIAGDVIRDHELSGGWKAVWVILLIIFPLITALVYLIVRGRGMGERQLAAAQQAQERTNNYIQSVAAKSAAPADQIASAKSLLDAGTINQEEFDALKAKALA